MRKGQDIVGKPIVAYDSGQKLNTVSDLIFDQSSNRLLGFLVDESGWFSDAKVLPINHVQAIGLDAVIIPSQQAIVSARSFPAIHQTLERNNILKGTRIMTLDGRDLGTMIDLYFNAQTGVIEGYEVSGGLFADAYSGRSYVPAPDTLKIGEDVAFVPSEIADLMEEQVGGLKAAMQSAGEKLQETALVAGDKLQQTSRSATTAITNTVIDSSEQKDFVLGKVAQYRIDAPEGGVLIGKGETVTPVIIDAAEYFHLLDELYRATGGSVTQKLGEHLGNVMASLTIEQALGRRARQTVYTLEGEVVAAAGQVVTSYVIERAKDHHQEQALLQAVGLSVQEATQARTETLASSTGTYLKEGAKGIWDQVKETANSLQQQSSQAIEEQRIKGALGHPVTRVILDREDKIILNVGELITHQAIDMARQANVLDILLSSVYTQAPQFLLEELRAKELNSNDTEIRR